MTSNPETADGAGVRADVDGRCRECGVKMTTRYCGACGADSASIGQDVSHADASGARSERPFSRISGASKKTILIGASAVTIAAVSTIAVVGTGSAGRLEGTFSAPAASETDGTCTSIGSGLTMYLRDGSGQVLDTATAADTGTWYWVTGGRCAHSFAFDNVADANQYEVSNSSTPGSGVFFSRDDLESKDWSVEVGVGL